MSADGYVHDMNQPVSASIYCYLCSKPVSSDPRRHQPCLDKHREYGTHLPISYEIDNVDY